MMPDELAQATAVLEDLNLQIALLDDQGQILYTNALWRSFVERLGGGDSVGINYLAVCPPDIAQEIQAVMRGERSQWTYDYPCHSPEERRFFRVEVKRVELAGRALTLMSHHNVTEQRLVELQSRALNAALIVQGELLTQYSLASSHTLQEPLRRLTATSSGLKALAKGNERVEKYADINMQAAQQMSALVSSLGQYARLSQQQRELHARYDLRAALEREAAEHGLATDFGELPPVILSEQHGRALVYNLVANVKDLCVPGEVLHAEAVQEGDFVHLYLRLKQLSREQASDAMKMFQHRGEAALGFASLLSQHYGGLMWTESGGAHIGLHLTLPAWRDTFIPA